MKFLITFSNGYCGCEIEEEFEGTCKNAEIFALDFLKDYAKSYAYAAFGQQEDYNNYFENCDYRIEEK